MSQLALLLLSASLLQAAGQACTASCTQGGHTSSCKDRINWAKDNVKDKSGKAIGLCPAIDLVNGDCHGQCSCQDTDLGTHCGPAPAPPAPTPTPPAPSPGGKYCGAISSKNACKPCTQESDCGPSSPLGASCRTGQDSSCTGTPPPTPAPVPKTGFCFGGSKSNACKPCGTEVDCGHIGIGQFSCWDKLDENCIPSTCSSTCNQGGHPSSCHDRVAWAKDNIKDKTGSPIGVCAAITLVNGDCKGQCLCKDKDFDEDCSPHIGYCKKSSKENACKGCNSEDDCGNDDTSSNEFFCQKVKDPTCGGPGPAPGPAAGHCEKSAPSNGCKGCNTEGDCGNNDPSPSKYYCQKAEDPACSGPGPSPAGAGWCTREAPKGACGHCSVESDCGNNQPGKYFCQSAKSWNCPMEDIVV